jgi:hypothetical protein
MTQQRRFPHCHPQSMKQHQHQQLQQLPSLAVQEEAHPEPPVALEGPTVDQACRQQSRS